MQKTIMFCAVIAFLSIIFIVEFALVSKLRKSENKELMFSVIIVSLILAVVLISIRMAVR